MSRHIEIYSKRKRKLSDAAPMRRLLCRMRQASIFATGAGLHRSGWEFRATSIVPLRQML
jgi:hypothetical protein